MDWLQPLDRAGSEWGALGSPGGGGGGGRSRVPAPVIQSLFPPSRWTGGPTDPLAHVPLGPRGTFASARPANLGPHLTSTPGDRRSRSIWAPVQCWGSSQDLSCPGCCVRALDPDPKRPGCNALHGPIASSSLYLLSPELCSSSQCPLRISSCLSMAHRSPHVSRAPGLARGIGCSCTGSALWLLFISQFHCVHCSGTLHCLGVSLWVTPWFKPHTGTSTREPHESLSG